jgi:hypothetical protein
MSHFIVLEICFLLLSDNDEEIGWLGSLHDGSDEGCGDIYAVGTLVEVTTWRISFPDGDIVLGMVPSSSNNFLWSLLYFIVVRSNHGERLVRISLSLNLMSISLGSNILG